MFIQIEYSSLKNTSISLLNNSYFKKALKELILT